MRQNPFQHVYDLCNVGHSKDKLANLPGFPHLIDIEMTNTCNFRCLMCPTGNFSQKREKGFMTDAVFERILENIAPYKTPLRFIRWGEPFTHPSIIEYLRAAKNAGIITHVNTNGSKFSDDIIDAIIDLPLDSLKFSFQGVDRQSYREMRNTDFFDNLVETMRGVRERRGDQLLPYLHASTTITYETVEQVEAFKALMDGVVDKVSVGHTVLEFVNLNTVRLHDDELEQLRILKQMESVVKKHPQCPEVFDKLAINWDGKVTACCTDSDNEMIIGNVMETSLEEIWRSDKLNHYREMLADMRHDEMPLCKTCYDYHGLHEAIPD